MRSLSSIRLLGAAVTLLLAAAPALAAGGGGASYCSNATGPGQGTAFSAGRFGSGYANPGDIVSTLVGILWGQGVGAPAVQPGAFTKAVCNPGSSN